MPAEFVDIALPFISSATLGTITLNDVVSLDVNLSHDSKPVKTMNRRRRSRGFQTNTPEYAADMEVAVQLANPEVDWIDLQQSKETFLIGYREGKGGQRRQLVDCQVADVSDAYSEEGEMRRRVSIMALDFRKVPG